MRVKELIDRLQEAAKRAGFTAEYFGHREDFPLVAFHLAPANPRARVYISAGVHGDEPAGPMAVLELFRRRAFHPEVAYHIVPVVNPLGLQAKTRENGDGVDINRSFGPTPSTPEAAALQGWLGEQQFDLALCLHEDYGAQGFYLYELTPAHLPAADPRRATMRPSPARSLLAVGAEYLPLDLSPLIDDMPNDQGLMQPPQERLAEWMDDIPEAVHLLRRHTPWCFTTETPSQAATIVDRIACQCAVVEATVNWLLQEG